MSGREPLPPDVEALLEIERRAEPPPVEAQARVARRLEVTLGVTVAAGLSGAAATASAAKATAATVGTVGKSIALKLILGAVGAALVGGGAYVALHKNTPPAPVPVVTRIAAPAPIHVAAEQQLPPVPPPPPLLRPRIHPRPGPQDFASEQAFLEEARAALVGGAPERALRLLGQEGHRFRSGPLTEARESLLVQALAASGQAEAARARALEFKKRFPHSLFQPAVDASLDGR